MKHAWSEHERAMMLCDPLYRALIPGLATGMLPTPTHTHAVVAGDTHSPPPPLEESRPSRLPPPSSTGPPPLLPRRSPRRAVSEYKKYRATEFDFGETLLKKYNIKKKVQKIIDMIVPLGISYEDHTTTYDDIELIRKSFDDRIKDILATSSYLNKYREIRQCITLLSKPDVLLDKDKTQRVKTLLEHMKTTLGNHWTLTSTAKIFELRWHKNTTLSIWKYILFLLTNYKFGTCLEFITLLEVNQVNIHPDDHPDHGRLEIILWSLKNNLPELVGYEAKRSFDSTNQKML